MYEKRHQPLLPRAKFILRLLKHFCAAFGLVAVALFLGIAGYHYFEGLGWIDAILNSSMILGGMGPVNPVNTTAGKIFASAYALFSGIVFLVIVGVLFAPVFHRFLHRFHLELDREPERGAAVKGKKDK
ncbi:MAG: hypothetical protein HF314_18355 [Ignavibacteria bacterium]|jgi:hypothetical protein|nr:hypothetical protein [Ignavibacteria bacterium]MCU7505052.1 hypothetical protein [Ignavibacteria bacterium]MCU7515308.1 hypothetical protein [Ignavibacteria bacterium]